MNNFCIIECLLCFGISTVSAITGGIVIESSQSNMRPINETEKSCLLPSHPENGQWVIIPFAPGKPGEMVDSKTSIRFSCNEGYKISSDGTFLATCLSGYWHGPLVACLKLCPKLYNTDSTKVRCFNKKNLTQIKCDETTDEISAQFECAPFYEMAGGQNNSRYCRAGSWDLPPPECVQACGQPFSGQPLITNGVTLEVGNYPWVAAIYHKNGEDFDYICGGTILTPKLILTAAHCVSDGNGNAVDSAKIKLAVGKYYNKYKDQRATLAQYSNVQEVLIHPSYRGNSKRYSSDIALLLVSSSFATSRVVQPVCFRNLPHVYLNDESTGIIAGWGYTTAGQGPTEKLSEISVPFKTNATCLSSLSPDWMDVYNGYDKFCAGRYNDSVEICRGDDGNGLVFKNPEDGRFYIHGIVSVEWKLNTFGCDKQLSTLYTRVAIHYDWLEQMVAEHS